MIDGCRRLDKLGENIDVRMKGSQKRGLKRKLTDSEAPRWTCGSRRMAEFEKIREKKKKRKEKGFACTYRCMHACSQHTQIFLSFGTSWILSLSLFSLFL